jgi:diguanylate cyclase (GGDEF)-like protein
MTYQGLPRLADRLAGNSDGTGAADLAGPTAATSDAAAIQAVLTEQANGLGSLDASLARRIIAIELQRNCMLGLFGLSGFVGLTVLMAVYLCIRQMEQDVVCMAKQLSAGEAIHYPNSDGKQGPIGVAGSVHQICAYLQQTAKELRFDREALQQEVTDHTQLVEHRAKHDPLTGLPNRAHFVSRLEAALAGLQPGATPIFVMFLDLLNFKSINDSLGHNAGDHILQAIAGRLSESAPATASTARLNSEEFAVLVQKVSSIDDVFAIAENILRDIRKPITMANINVYPSGTIGIAACTSAESSAESLLHDAETAMYHARSEGREPFALFESSMTDKLTDRTQLESELHYALERNEFVVHYQPLISLETGTMSGAEALIRWDHPRLGMVQPGRFLPIAEDTGLIVPIGYWVLREACREAKEWQNNHPSAPAFTINVNLSGRQLERDDVVDQVSAALKETGINPSLLKLEITESVMMKDVDKTVARLHSLKALGIKLAMDDFGTGYSSIACLNLFPIDTVKIDKSFVQSLADQPQAMSIVAAIISLARALNMDVTGEGVETVEHVTFLQSMGCHVGQGYYFAKALTSSAMAQKVIAGARATIGSADAAERDLIERLLRAA